MISVSNLLGIYVDAHTFKLITNNIRFSFDHCVKGGYVTSDIVSFQHLCSTLIGSLFKYN